MFEFGAVEDAALIARLQAAERSIATAQAEQLAVIAALHTRAPAWITNPDPLLGGVEPIEATTAEVGAALRISKPSAYRRTELALRVCTRLPRTLVALGRGEITMAKLRVIDEATDVLTPEHAKAVEDRVLPRAGSQTPSGLGASVARAVISADPAAAERRREKAVRERTVAFYPGADGMATIWLRAPAAAALAAYRRLGELAETARTPGDERSAGARCADTLIDLVLDSRTVMHLTPVPDLLGAPSAPSAPSAPPAASAPPAPRGEPGGPTDRGSGVPPGSAPSSASPSAAGRLRWAAGPATVHVTVPWTTLAGLDDLSGQLAGYGPITAEYARELAADATWRRLLTDPATGTVLDVGTTTYRPPAGLAALVRARDGTCRWFGCRLPAERCDLDHTVPHPRGPTADDNLAALCKPHHRLKTHTAWRVTHSEGGVLAWTSPAGQRISTRPWSADSDPDPPETPSVLDDDPPARPEPDWLELDAMPTDADIAAQLARYGTLTEFDCAVGESDFDAA